MYFQDPLRICMRIKLMIGLRMTLSPRYFTSACIEPVDWRLKGEEAEARWPRLVTSIKRFMSYSMVQPASNFMHYRAQALLATID